MNDEQIKALEKLVEVSEEFKCPRVIIDYAINLVDTFAKNYMGDEMTAYVERLYQAKYPDL